MPASKLHRSRRVYESDLVLTTRSERDRIPESMKVYYFDDTIYPVEKEEVHAFVHLIASWLQGGSEHLDSITIGIDPGVKKTGMALLLNHVLAEVTTVDSEFEAIRSKMVEFSSIARKLQSRGEKTDIVVKVGYGFPDATGKILDIIKTLDKDVDTKIVIVDEFQSNTENNDVTNNAPGKLGPDEKAAINIALREGTSLKELDRELKRRLNIKERRRGQPENGDETIKA